MAATIGKLSVLLSLNSKGYSKGLNRSGRSTESFSKSVGRSLKKVTAYGAVIGGAAAAATSLLVKRQFSAIDSTAKLADTLGLATEQLVGLEHAAGLAGIGQKELSTGIRRLQKNISDSNNGLTTAKRAFDALGLSSEALDKLSPDEQIKAVADALPRLTSQADRARVAQDLFGRSGLKMIKLLEQGGDAIGRQQAEAAALGLTFNRLDAAKVESANDAVSRLSAAFTGVFRTVAVKIAPAVSRVATMIVDKWIAIRTRVLEVSKSISTGVVKAIEKISAFYAPYAVQLVNTTMAVGSSILSIVSTVAKGIARVVGFLIGGTGTLIESVTFYRDTVIAALAIVEFEYKNFSKIVEYATIKAAAKIVEFGGIIQHTFTVAVPRYIQWFADNAKEILLTFGANTLTFVENLASNIVQVVKNLPKLISGQVDLSDIWSPLSDGFVNVIGELPDIPKREMGELEKLLKTEASRLGDEVGGDFSDHLAKRMADIGKNAGIGGGFIDSLTNLFSGDGFSVPDFSMDPQSLSALETANKDGIKLGVYSGALERGSQGALEVAMSGRNQNREAIETAKNTKSTAREAAESNRYLRELARENRSAAIQIVSF